MIESKNMVSYWENAWDIDNSNEVNQFAKTAIKIISNKDKNKILDLGCGNGCDAIFFHQQGFNVTDVDFSQKTIDTLVKEYPEITWLNHDLKDPFDKIGKFDVVYAHLSLHYFEESISSEIFLKIFNILNDDGLLFVKCKSIKDPLFGKGKHIGDNRYHLGHTRNFFTVAYMMEKLKRFKIISINEIAHDYRGNQSAFIEAIAKK